MAESGHLEILPVPGLPEVTEGDDLADLVVEALRGSGTGLADGDVVVVSSKVVSKAEGRGVTAPTRDAAIGDQTRRIVAERLGPRGVTRVVESRSGPVLAAAGVDASNVPPGTVLLLPADPDASARRLRARFRAVTGARVGVVVSDTAGRAWRDGQVDLAIGAAGVRVTDDLRGGTDTFGAPLEVTVRALADELASAADLVKGKLTGTPVAVVRGPAGLVTDDDGPGAVALLRAPGTDWFALGHVEAVRAALGVPPGDPAVPLQPLVPGDAEERLTRAVAVACAGSGGAAPPPARSGEEIGSIGQLPPVTVEVTAVDAAEARVTVVPVGTGSVGTGSVGTGSVGTGSVGTGSVGTVRAAALGALAQRVLAAAWSEGLDASGTVDDDGHVVVTARVRA